MKISKVETDLLTRCAWYIAPALAGRPQCFLLMSRFIKESHYEYVACRYCIDTCLVKIHKNVTEQLMSKGPSFSYSFKCFLTTVLMCVALWRVCTSHSTLVAIWSRHIKVRYNLFCFPAYSAKLRKSFFCYFRTNNSSWWTFSAFIINVFKLLFHTDT